MVPLALVRSSGFEIRSSRVERQVLRSIESIELEKADISGMIGSIHHSTHSQYMGMAPRLGYIARWSSRDSKGRQLEFGNILPKQQGLASTQ